MSRRTGAEWLRAMVAAGIVRKLRAMFVGRWSAVDTWVESGGQTKRVGGRLRDAVCAAGAQ